MGQACETAPIERGTHRQHEQEEGIIGLAVALLSRDIAQRQKRLERASGQARHREFERQQFDRELLESIQRALQLGLLKDVSPETFLELLHEALRRQSA